MRLSAQTISGLAARNNMSIRPRPEQQPVKDSTARKDLVNAALQAWKVTYPDGSSKDCAICLEESKTLLIASNI
jgi:hypothetical protein